MPNDDVIIVGSLSDKELRDSIDKLVNYVGNQTSVMASNFVVSMDLMKGAMKDFAITQKVSVDLMQEAWRKMSTSFDAMVAAQSTATSGGGGGKPSAEEGTVRWLEQQSKLQKEVVRDQKLGTTELQNEVDKHAAINEQLKNELKNTKQIQQETAKRTLKNVLSLPQNELKEAEYRLKVLLNTASAYKTRKAGILSEEQWHKLNNAIAKTRQQIDKLQEKKPKSLKDVLGMDESSLDAITAKMRALKRVQIDPKNTFEVKQLGDAYSELQRQQAKLMGKNIQLTHSNNYLAQSFGYIRNRIVYALTLGALSQFTKQVFAVRGEYEMLERSLGVLVNSFEKGSQIFQELNEMAIKSPFTLVELGTAAKQLTAYNFAANEVVDTTRRLADISAALGVPMERLTYNLGQIKAQGVLNARDARDFANAGLAIVPMLAQLYTEQKRFGEEMVTTAQVYDMMSKKLVSYSDVLSVLYKITDEGGKFFDFQAKQAETLKVQMNNLTLAMNNMYNEIGASNQGLLVGTVQVTKKIFENWKTVLSIIQSLIVTYGAYKTILAIVNAIHMRTWGARMIIGITQYINAIRSATGAMATFNAVMSSNAIVAFSSALLGVASYFLFFRQSVNKTTVDIERFGESGAKAINNIETLGRIIKGVDENTSLYKKTVGELNQILREYGLSEIQTRDEINGKIEKTIELIKEESASRNRANMLARGQETFTNTIKDANEELSERLTSTFETTGVRKELNKNVDIITSVIGDIVQENISLIANKTGDEYEKGMKQIFEVIEERMRRIGISEKTIEQQLSYKSQFNKVNFANIREYITDISKAKQALDDYNNKTEANYRAAQKATQSTMSMAEKINYNANAMKNASQDAVSLYNRVYEIVKLAQENHVITFDLKLTAENPPKWMMNMDLPKLQELAARFTAIAQSGGRVKGYNQEQTYERGLMYASAARQKQYEEERKALEERNKTKQKVNPEDEVAKALNQEISLIKEMQSNYDKLRKSGVSNMDAIDLASKGYEATIIRINQVLSKFGIDKFNAANFAGKDVRSLLQSLEEQRQALLASGKVKTSSLQALDVEIQKLTVDAKTYDMKKVTDGLNSELGKIKDEYELAIELDSNPELGDMFTDMFNVDTSTLPQTFGEAYQRAVEEAQKQLAKLKEYTNANFKTEEFDLLKANFSGDKNGLWNGIDINSEVIQNLIKAQKTWRDMYQKNLVDTEKMLDDYVKKYGNYSDKIAELERDRLEKIKKLNDAYYTEEMRRRPEYIAKMNAINQGASREKSNVEFDAFKNSRYYTMMFENLDYISTKTIRDMRDRLRELMDSMKDLTPEQLKQVMSQYEKLEQKLVNRSPFKTLTKDLKNYLKTSGDRKAANEAFRNAQKEYDAQEKNVAALKEKYEQTKANNNTSQSYLDFLKIEIDGESEILQILKEQLDAAQKKADKYNLIKKLALEELSQTATMVASNLKGLAELRDQMNELFGVDASKGETLLGHKIDGMIDGLAKASDGISKVTSSAQSGNVFGVVGGVVDVFTGIGDGIASLFGDGSARTKRLNREINESKETVRQLSMAYDDLERAIDKSLGTGETEARRLAIANKEAQLAELERQKELEQSKRSKDRDDDAIKQYEESIHSLRNEIDDLKQDVVNNLWGEDVKSAAEAFVDAWVQAWRAAETTLDAIQEKMDEMIYNLIKKAMTSKIVETLLNPIYKELDRMTKEGSEGGVALTTNELRQLAQQAGITAGEINTALGEFYGNLEQLGIVSKTEDKSSELSALQQGIQGVTEDTAGAIEAYMNIVAQRVFEQNLYLQEIRDHLNNFDLDVQLGTLSQMLLQLQQSYQVQQNIESILTGVLNPSGRAIVVELNS